MHYTKIALLTAIMLGVFAAPSVIWAEDLSPTQQEALQGEGISAYPGASFTTSDDSPELLVMWFRSTESPEKIMAWYRHEIPSWSVMEVNGMTVIYKGAPGLEASQLADTPYIFTRKTTESEPVVSEITIRLPKK